MILILTTEYGDYSHTAFIDWLKYYEANFFILSGEAINNGRFDISLKNKELIVDGINFNKEVSVVLNRRFLSINDLPDISEDFKFNNGLKKRISDELYEFRDFLPHINNACWIPNRQSTHVNKLQVLQKAIDLNINIPPYLVTNSKFELKYFRNIHNQIITKAIGNFQPVFTSKNDIVNPIYTKLISSWLLRSDHATDFGSNGATLKDPAMI